MGVDLRVRLITEKTKIGASRCEIRPAVSSPAATMGGRGGTLLSKLSPLPHL